MCGQPEWRPMHIIIIFIFNSNANVVQFRIAVNISHTTHKYLMTRTKRMHERATEKNRIDAWLKCLLECNKIEEYIEMLFQNLRVCIIIIIMIKICGSRQHQIDTTKYEHHLDIIFRFVCACALACEYAFMNQANNVPFCKVHCECGKTIEYGILWLFSKAFML